LSSLLSVSHLAKAYAGVQALVDVNFELAEGEIHALCGENGAGKSTLIKILGGIIPFGAYSGKIFKEGVEKKFQNPKEALASGVSVVHQELALAPDLSVAENIFLGNEPTHFGWVNHNQLIHDSLRILALLGQENISPFDLVRTLSVGKRQMVEIARALRPQKNTSLSRILILDEPTSALSFRESKILLDQLLKLKQPNLSIVYVSHKLEEVFSIADRISVLRNGSSIQTLKCQETNSAEIISLMLGRRLGEVFPARTPNPNSSLPNLLSVRNWTVPSHVNRDVTVLENINFDLKSGEILGIAGLMGSGRTELVESLFGIGANEGNGSNVSSGSKGSLKILGKDFYPNNAAWSISQGLALVPEDRRKHGLMLEKSIRHNITSACLQRFCFWKQVIKQTEEIKQTKNSMHELGVKAPHGDFNVGMLSGGNQQKVVLAKWLLTHPKILFLDDPTRGVDVGAKSEIYRLIQKLASTGIGIILISSENEEVLHLAHRILILRQGKIVAEFKGEEANSETVLELCAGVKAA